MHQFLPVTVGQPAVDNVLTGGRKFYTWRNDPFIPVEFSVAAYRFGHSQVRPSYRANFGTSATDPALQFSTLIFDPAAIDPADPADFMRPQTLATGLRPCSRTAIRASLVSIMPLRIATR